MEIKKIKLRFLFWTSIFLWLILNLVSLLFQIHHIKDHSKNYAYSLLKIATENNLILRHWVTSKGGVYVYLTNENLPNPYLDFLPERDIKTVDGKQLTLMNPAYVSRQFFEILNKRQVLTGRLTSLNPVNPINYPDKFEAIALKKFESNKVTEVFDIDNEDSIPKYRLVLPFITEKACLKCHAHQGFKVGDVRGGISMSVPLHIITELEVGKLWQAHLTHFILWIFGNVLIIFAFIGLKRSVKENESISKELFLSEQRLKSIFQSAGIAFILTNLEEKIIQYNQTATDLFKFSDNDILDKRFIDFVLPEYFNQVNNAIQNIKSKNINNERIEIQCKKNNNHKIIWIDLTITPVNDDHNNKLYILFACVNITKRKEAEEALNNLKYQFEMILNTAAEGIIGLDKELNHIFINSEALKMLGYSQEELIGSNPLTNWRIKDKDSNPIDILNCEILKSLNKGSSVYVPEDIFWCKNGLPLQVEFRCSPILSYGIVDGAVITFSDITERVKMNKAMINLINELEEANIRIEADLYQKNALNEKLQHSENELKKANEAKTKFLSILAHDIRNPLGSFKSLTKLMKDEYDEFSDTDRKEIVEKMEESSSSIYELLENLLQWSRTQTGVIVFNPESINIKNIADKVINLLNLNAQIKKIEIVNLIDDKLNVYADLNMIYTIIRNLVSNAIKFTKENGKVTIANSINDNFIIIQVKDTGVGISEKDITKLFRIDTSFKQLGTNDEKGTGLGLILCKEFVEKHGGRIWVESALGLGSQFSFSLPNK